jgi:hypothetical protein
MNALGQKLACAQRASQGSAIGRRRTADAAQPTDTRAHERNVRRTSLLSWLDVEDHAQPGAAIWIVAVAAMLCIGLTYAYFSHITG